MRGLENSILYVLGLITMHNWKQAEARRGLGYEHICPFKLIVYSTEKLKIVKYL